MYLAIFHLLLASFAEAAPPSLHIRVMWRESEGCGCKKAVLSPFYLIVFDIQSLFWYQQQRWGGCWDGGEGVKEGDSGDLRIQTAAVGTLTAFAARLASAWFWNVERTLKCSCFLFPRFALICAAESEIHFFFQHLGSFQRWRPRPLHTVSWWFLRDSFVVVGSCVVVFFPNFTKII